MKLKQREVISAYKAVQELAGVRFPYKTAREVAALRRRLREEYETAAEREAKLAVEIGVETVETGQFRTNDPAKAADFRKQSEAQMEEEAEIDLPAVDLSAFSEMLRVSPDCLEALEGIVVFEKEGAT